MHGIIRPLCLVTLLACTGTDEDTAAFIPRGESPDFSPPEPQVKRLTETQYFNSIADIFSDQIAVTTQLDPLEESNGLYAVGASVSTVSPLGVERFETAAYQIAEQAMDDEEMRLRLVPCEPKGTRDDECAALALEGIGFQIWRRSLDSTELDGLVDIAGIAAETLGDFHDGLEYGIAALLQSPHFLYRIELGEPDDAGGYRYTDYEMASRLSYFLWNTTPDQTLLDAAELGGLTETEDLAFHVDRMLSDDRARAGMRAFFIDMLNLHELDDLTKDPLIFLYMSDDLGESAREETLVGLEQLIFEDNADYRELFTTQDAWVNRRLASIYNVPAPSMDGFAWTTLSNADRRRGFFGQVSFLALQSHAVSTSVTLRGKFIRENILCQNIPDPPSDVDTSIPEVSAEAATMRERVAIHLEDPACAVCHEITDPLGLGLENFDGIGRWRTSENGVAIDASGDLDDHEFNDAWELSEAVAQHDRLGLCLTETMLGYAGGFSIGDELDDLAEWHTHGLENADYRVQWLMRDIAMSPGFRTAGEVGQ